MKPLKPLVFALALACAPPALAATAPDIARAEAQFAAGKYAAAAKTYEAILARDPNNVEALVGLSTIFQYLDVPDSALKWAQAALRVAPDNNDALIARVNAWISLGENDKARADVDKVLKAGPHAEALNYRGYLLAEAKDYTGALASYQQAAALNADRKSVV